MSTENIPELVAVADDDDDQAADRVPVTIITGFLALDCSYCFVSLTIFCLFLPIPGSGKTTLINYILTAAHGKRIAVILNDFGEGSAVESTVSLREHTDDLFEEWIELRNGCLCCSLKDPGVKAIENLMQKRGRFDYIMLETTGLADPGKCTPDASHICSSGPIAALFWMDESLCSQIALDGVVTLLDAKYCLSVLKAHATDERVNVCERQIALADILILNKVDLVEEHEKHAVLEEIRCINSTAKVIETNFSAVDLSEILDLNLYSSSRSIERLKAAFIPDKPHLDHGILQFVGEDRPCSLQCVNELYDIFSLSVAATAKLGPVGVRLIFIGMPM
ncbi:unnamed protein product [Schistocephalus solidus]|uniref:CobW domain-containing protein n=1 Tax=Schistocephalus solidus TaxID=70667 RepID=A0A183TNW2_SCHSO|nr:unnamed protein product [Schistocephalus solidus]